MRRSWLLPAVALVVVASGCVTGAPSLEIGAVYPTGGSQGPGGVHELRGVELAASMARGLGGTAVRVRVERADSADAAPQAVRRLHAAGVPIVVGSYGSTVSRAAAETAEELGVVFWETGAVGELGMHAASGRHVFRFPPTGGSLGRAAATFVRDQIAPASGRDDLRYSVVYVDDVYGRSVGLGAADEIRTSGRTLVAVVPYTLPGVDYAGLARAVAAARTDVLVVAAYLDDGVAIRRAIVDQRVPLVANIGTSSSYCMHEFGERLGDAAVGVFASDKPDGDFVRTDTLAPDAARVLELARREYVRRFGEHMTAAALSGFSAAWALLRYVLPNADSTDADGIARAARKTRLAPGALPNGSGLEFGPAGSGPDNLRATSVIWEWTRPGVREVVWPPAFATAPITSAHA